MCAGTRGFEIFGPEPTGFGKPGFGNFSPLTGIFRLFLENLNKKI
jgi:hypothetical protein